MLEILKKIQLYGFSRSLRFITEEFYRLLVFKLLRNSYSQQGEDLVIDKLLVGKKKGFYVDVGAHDPVRFSNTKRFYGRGWNGINIDPNPALIKKFQKQRLRDINLALGVGTKKGELTFYEFFPSTLSTLSGREAKECVKNGFRIVSKKKVPVQTLSSILDKHRKGKTIDFLSVDTEGTDLEVLQSNNWKRFKPRVICVETKGNFSRIRSFLEKRGYKLRHSNGINSIFSVS